MGLKISRSLAEKNGAVRPKVRIVEGKKLDDLPSEVILEIMGFLTLPTWLRLESVSKLIQEQISICCNRKFKKLKFDSWVSKPVGQKTGLRNYKKQICLRAKFTLVFKKFMDECSKILDGNSDYEGRHGGHRKKSLFNINEVLKLLTWINKEKLGKWKNEVNTQKQLFSLHSENISITKKAKKLFFEHLYNSDIIYGFIKKGSIYIGNVKNYQANGQGTCIYIDGAKREGNWKNDRANGHGILYLKNGAKNYDGNWKNDGANGHGTLYRPDGAKYVGKFKNGEKNGHGIFYHRNGAKKYEGNWENDIPNGQGILYRRDGRIKFEGNFINGTEVYVLES